MGIKFCGSDERYCCELNINSNSYDDYNLPIPHKEYGKLSGTNIFSKCTKVTVGDQNKPNNTTIESHLCQKETWTKDENKIVTKDLETLCKASSRTDSSPEFNNLCKQYKCCSILPDT